MNSENVLSETSQMLKDKYWILQWYESGPRTDNIIQMEERLTRDWGKGDQGITV